MREGWSDYKIERGNRPIVNGLYKHFKGNIYIVKDIITNEENRDKSIVVYQSIADGNKWGRDLEIFMSDVDAEKYPEFTGKPRFEYLGRVY